MIIRRYRKGDYTVLHHSLPFYIRDNHERQWVLTNHKGVEIYRTKTKGAIVDALSSYGPQETMDLHNQEHC
jgi:hypothetical protein